ncbi:hypothetical protein FHR62_002743 [Xanthomonas arboricola]|nr:hypothetical protein [Xanthomonas arboricola]
MPSAWWPLGSAAQAWSTAQRLPRRSVPARDGHYRDGSSRSGALLQRRAAIMQRHAVIAGAGRCRPPGRYACTAQRLPRRSVPARDGHYRDSSSRSGALLQRRAVMVRRDAVIMGAGSCRPLYQEAYTAQRLPRRSVPARDRALPGQLLALRRAPTTACRHVQRDAAGREVAGLFTRRLTRASDCHVGACLRATGVTGTAPRAQARSYNSVPLWCGGDAVIMGAGSCRPPGQDA